MGDPRQELSSFLDTDAWWEVDKSPRAVGESRREWSREGLCASVLPYSHTAFLPGIKGGIHGSCYLFSYVVKTKPGMSSSGKQSIPCNKHPDIFCGLKQALSDYTLTGIALFPRHLLVGEMNLTLQHLLLTTLRGKVLDQLKSGFESLRQLPSVQLVSLTYPCPIARSLNAPRIS